MPSAMSNAHIDSGNISQYPTKMLHRKVIEKAGRPLMMLTDETIGCCFYSVTWDKDWYEESERVLNLNEISLVNNLNVRLCSFESMLRISDDTDRVGALFEAPDNYKLKRIFKGGRQTDALDEVRVLALDRILWCREEGLEPKRQLTHLPNATLGNPLLGLLAHVYHWKRQVRWLKNVIDGMRTDHAQYRLTSESNQMCVEFGSGLTDKEKMESLIQLEAGTAKKESSAKLMAKFARVSASLHMLSVADLENTRKEMAKYSASTDLTTDLISNEPTDFYRLLIICVAVSPLALLGDSMWTKVSFPKAMQGGRTPLPNNPILAVLSKALIKMFVCLSEQGGQAYYPLLNELSTTLEARGVFKAAETGDDIRVLDEEFFRKEYASLESKIEGEASRDLFSSLATYVKERCKKIANTGEDGDVEMAGEGRNNGAVLTNNDEAPARDPSAAPTGGEEPRPETELSRSEAAAKRKRETDREKAEREKAMEKSEKRPEKKRKRSGRKKNNGGAEKEPVHAPVPHLTTPKPLQKVYKCDEVDMAPPKNRGKGLKGTLAIDLQEATAIGNDVRYAPLRVEIPKFNNCAVEAYKNLDIILSRRTSSPSDANVEVVAWEAWEGFTVAEKRMRLAKNSIHVVGKKGPSIMPRYKGWNKASLSHYMDVGLSRYVNDHTMYRKAEKKLFKSNLLTAIEAVNSKREAVFNFLDIKLAPGRIRPDFMDLEDGQVLARSHYDDYTWNTPLYYGSSTWALVSLKNALSDIHMDAAGYCTFVEAVVGRKIWIVGSDPVKGVPNEDGWDPEQSKWYALAINAGDQFYMRPSTPHMVLTTEHSIFAGGHFYMKELFGRSLIGITLCHYFGYHVTNESHMKATTAFHRLAAHYANEMLVKRKSANEEDQAEYDYIRDEEDESLPSDKDLALLAVLVLHLDDLHPPEVISNDKDEGEGEGEGEDEDEDEDEAFWNDRKYDLDQAYARKRMETLIIKKIEATPEFLVALREANKVFQEHVDACEEVTMLYANKDDPETLLTTWGFGKLKSDPFLMALCTAPVL